MLIMGGIYFELQSPGIGFPLGAAVIAAIIYFAPLYLEGLAENWEFLIFILGIILIIVEVFAIPGFGVAGISGILLVVTGLTLSMVDNIVFQLDLKLALEAVVKSLFTVLIAIFLSLTLSLFISKQVFSSRKLKFALYSTQEKDQGFVGVDAKTEKQSIGKTGTAVTILRPAGKVEINGEMFDALSKFGYIEKGNKIKVISDEAGQLIVIKL
ncbi:MAG: nodulation protein NfeD, partial [Bacteroidales bacterium]|nr:nodulation protein NfeD [Bacteroidales bacterium]